MIVMEFLRNLFLSLLLGDVLVILLLHTVQVEHLLHYERGIVALVFPGLTVGDLDGTGGHLVEEVSVVADHHAGGMRVQKEVLQPFHGIYVEVAGRLVEEQ